MAEEFTPMEPQHFRPKRWVRWLQIISGTLVFMMGMSAFGAQNGNVLIGVAAVVVGMFTLGQGLYSAVIATEDEVFVRRNIWPAKGTAWEEIDYCMPGNPMAIRLVNGKILRLVPLLEEAEELRSMIDDTVGPPPA